jgi:hypothetical protein
MKPETMVKADFVTGLVLVVFGIVVIEESWRMPRLEHLGVHELSTPGVVPALLGAILAVFGAILVFRSVGVGGHRLGLTRKAIGAAFMAPENRRLAIALVLTVGYAGGLVGTIPFWLATGLFVFAFVAVFEWRPGMTGIEWRRLGIVSAILAVAVAGVVTWTFQTMFLVTLP